MSSSSPSIGGGSSGQPPLALRMAAYRFQPSLSEVECWRRRMGKAPKAVPNIEAVTAADSAAIVGIAPRPRASLASVSSSASADAATAAWGCADDSDDDDEAAKLNLLLASATNSNGKTAGQVEVRRITFGSTEDEGDCHDKASLTMKEKKVPFEEDGENDDDTANGLTSSSSHVSSSFSSFSSSVGQQQKKVDAVRRRDEAPQRLRDVMINFLFEAAQTAAAVVGGGSCTEQHTSSFTATTATATRTSPRPSPSDPYQVLFATTYLLPLVRTLLERQRRQEEEDGGAKEKGCVVKKETEDAAALAVAGDTNVIASAEVFSALLGDLRHQLPYFVEWVRTAEAYAVLSLAPMHAASWRWRRPTPSPRATPMMGSAFSSPLFSSLTPLLVDSSVSARRARQSVVEALSTAVTAEGIAEAMHRRDSAKKRSAAVAAAEELDGPSSSDPKISSTDANLAQSSSSSPLLLLLPSHLASMLRRALAFVTEFAELHFASHHIFAVVGGGLASAPSLSAVSPLFHALLATAGSQKGRSGGKEGGSNSLPRLPFPLPPTTGAVPFYGLNGTANPNAAPQRLFLKAVTELRAALAAWVAEHVIRADGDAAAAGYTLPSKPTTIFGGGRRGGAAAAASLSTIVAAFITRLRLLLLPSATLAAKYPPPGVAVLPSSVVKRYGTTRNRSNGNSNGLSDVPHSPQSLLIDAAMRPPPLAAIVAQQFEGTYTDPTTFAEPRISAAAATTAPLFAGGGQSTSATTSSASATAPRRIAVLPKSAPTVSAPAAEEKAAVADDDVDASDNAASADIAVPFLVPHKMQRTMASSSLSPSAASKDQGQEGASSSVAGSATPPPGAATEVPERAGKWLIPRPPSATPSASPAASVSTTPQKFSASSSSGLLLGAALLGSSAAPSAPQSKPISSSGTTAGQQQQQQKQYPSAAIDLSRFKEKEAAVEVVDGGSNSAASVPPLVAPHSRITESPAAYLLRHVEQRAASVRVVPVPSAATLQLLKIQRWLRSWHQRHGADDDDGSGSVNADGGAAGGAKKKAAAKKAANKKDSSSAASPRGRPPKAAASESGAKKATIASAQPKKKAAAAAGRKRRRRGDSDDIHNDSTTTSSSSSSSSSSASEKREASSSSLSAGSSRSLSPVEPIAISSKAAKSGDAANADDDMNANADALSLSFSSFGGDDSLSSFASSVADCDDDDEAFSSAAHTSRVPPVADAAAAATVDSDAAGAFSPVAPPTADALLQCADAEGDDAEDCPPTADNDDLLLHGGNADVGADDGWTQRAADRPADGNTAATDETATAAANDSNKKERKVRDKFAHLYSGAEDCVGPASFIDENGFRVSARTAKREAERLRLMAAAAEAQSHRKGYFGDTASTVVAAAGGVVVGGGAAGVGAVVGAASGRSPLREAYGGAYSAPAAGGLSPMSPLSDSAEGGGGGASDAFASLMAARRQLSVYAASSPAGGVADGGGSAAVAITNIAILDGPTGAGKTTVAQIAAMMLRAPNAHSSGSGAFGGARALLRKAARKERMRSQKKEQQRSHRTALLQTLRNHSDATHRTIVFDDSGSDAVDDVNDGSAPIAAAAIVVGGGGAVKVTVKKRLQQASEGVTRGAPSAAASAAAVSVRLVEISSSSHRRHARGIERIFSDITQTRRMQDTFGADALAGGGASGGANAASAPPPPLLSEMTAGGGEGTAAWANALARHQHAAEASHRAGGTVTITCVANNANTTVGNCDVNANGGHGLDANDGTAAVALSPKTVSVSRGLCYQPIASAEGLSRSFAALWEGTALRGAVPPPPPQCGSGAANAAAAGGAESAAMDALGGGTARQQAFSAISQRQLKAAAEAEAERRRAAQAAEEQRKREEAAKARRTNVLAMLGEMKKNAPPPKSAAAASTAAIAVPKQTAMAAPAAPLVDLSDDDNAAVNSKAINDAATVSSTAAVAETVSAATAAGDAATKSKEKKAPAKKSRKKKTGGSDESDGDDASSTDSDDADADGKATTKAKGGKKGAATAPKKGSKKKKAAEGGVEAEAEPPAPVAPPPPQPTALQRFFGAASLKSTSTAATAAPPPQKPSASAAPPAVSKTAEKKAAAARQAGLMSAFLTGGASKGTTSSSAATAAPVAAMTAPTAGTTSSPPFLPATVDAPAEPPAKPTPVVDVVETDNKKKEASATVALIDDVDDVDDDDDEPSVTGGKKTAAPAKTKGAAPPKKEAAAKKTAAKVPGKGGKAVAVHATAIDDDDNSVAILELDCVTASATATVAPKKGRQKQQSNAMARSDVSISDDDDDDTDNAVARILSGASATAVAVAPAASAAEVDDADSLDDILLGGCPPSAAAVVLPTSTVAVPLHAPSPPTTAVAAAEKDAVVVTNASVDEEEEEAEVVAVLDGKRNDPAKDACNVAFVDVAEHKATPIPTLMPAAKAQQQLSAKKVPATATTNANSSVNAYPEIISLSSTVASAPFGGSGLLGEAAALSASAEAIAAECPIPLSPSTPFLFPEEGGEAEAADADEDRVAKTKAQWLIDAVFTATARTRHAAVVGGTSCGTAANASGAEATAVLPASTATTTVVATAACPSSNTNTTGGTGGPHDKKEEKEKQKKTKKGGAAAAASASTNAHSQQQQQSLLLVILEAGDAAAEDEGGFYPTVRKASADSKVPVLVTANVGLNSDELGRVTSLAAADICKNAIAALGRNAAAVAADRYAPIPLFAAPVEASSPSSVVASLPSSPPPHALCPSNIAYRSPLFVGASSSSQRRGLVSLAARPYTTDFLLPDLPADFGTIIGRNLAATAGAKGAAGGGDVSTSVTAVAVPSSAAATVPTSAGSFGAGGGSGSAKVGGGSVSSGAGTSASKLPPFASLYHSPKLSAPPAPQLHYSPDSCVPPSSAPSDSSPPLLNGTICSPATLRLFTTARRERTPFVGGRSCAAAVLASNTVDATLYSAIAGGLSEVLGHGCYGATAPTAGASSGLDASVAAALLGGGGSGSDCSAPAASSVAATAAAVSSSSSSSSVSANPLVIASAFGGVAYQINICPSLFVDPVAVLRRQRAEDGSHWLSQRRQAVAGAAKRLVEGASVGGGGGGAFPHQQQHLQQQQQQSGVAVCPLSGTIVPLNDASQGLGREQRLRQWAAGARSAASSSCSTTVSASSAEGGGFAAAARCGDDLSTVSGGLIVADPIGGLSFAGTSAASATPSTSFSLAHPWSRLTSTGAPAPPSLAPSAVASLGASSLAPLFGATTPVAMATGPSLLPAFAQLWLTAGVELGHVVFVGSSDDATGVGIAAKKTKNSAGANACGSSDTDNASRKEESGREAAQSQRRFSRVLRGKTFARGRSEAVVVSPSKFAELGRRILARLVREGARRVPLIPAAYAPTYDAFSSSSSSSSFGEDDRSTASFASHSLLQYAVGTTFDVRQLLAQLQWDLVGLTAAVPSVAEGTCGGGIALSSSSSSIVPSRSMLSLVLSQSLEGMLTTKDQQQQQQNPQKAHGSKRRADDNAAAANAAAALLGMLTSSANSRPLSVLSLLSNISAITDASSMGQTDRFLWYRFVCDEATAIAVRVAEAEEACALLAASLRSSEREERDKRRANFFNAPPSSSSSSSATVAATATAATATAAGAAVASAAPVAPSSASSSSSFFQPRKKAVAEVPADASSPSSSSLGVGVGVGSSVRVPVAVAVDPVPSSKKATASAAVSSTAPKTATTKTVPAAASTMEVIATAAAAAAAASPPPKAAPMSAFAMLMRGAAATASSTTDAAGKSSSGAAAGAKKRPREEADAVSKKGTADGKGSVVGATADVVSSDPSACTLAAASSASSSLAPLSAGASVVDLSSVIAVDEAGVDEDAKKKKEERAAKASAMAGFFKPKVQQAVSQPPLADVTSTQPPPTSDVTAAATVVAPPPPAPPKLFAAPPPLPLKEKKSTAATDSFAVPTAVPSSISACVGVLPSAALLSFRSLCAERRDLCRLALAKVATLTALAANMTEGRQRMLEARGEVHYASFLPLSSSSSSSSVNRQFQSDANPFAMLFGGGGGGAPSAAAAHYHRIGSAAAFSSVLFGGGGWGEEEVRSGVDADEATSTLFSSMGATASPSSSCATTTLAADPLDAFVRRTACASLADVAASAVYEAAAARGVDGFFESCGDFGEGGEEGSPERVAADMAVPPLSQLDLTSRRLLTTILPYRRPGSVRAMKAYPLATAEAIFDVSEHLLWVKRHEDRQFL